METYLKMINPRRAAKRKQRLESEGIHVSKVEKKRQILENKLKVLGYYKGEAVFFTLGIDGIEVHELSEERKTDFIKPVRCRCSYPE